MQKNTKKSKKSGVFSICAFANSVFGFISIITIFILIKLSSFDQSDVLLYGLVIYLSAVILFDLLVVLVSNLKTENKLLKETGSVSNLLSLDFIQNFNSPVVICTSKGQIVWYNNALQGALKNKSTIIGKFLDSICNVTLEFICKYDSEDSTEIKLSLDGDTSSDPTIYRASSYEVSSKGNQYFVITFDDVTIYKQTLNRLDSESTLVACAMIDNIDELVNYNKGAYNNVVPDVYNILKQHIEKINGIVRESGRNRFVLVFERQYLKYFEENKFSILDEVREIDIGDSSIPVTMSIGIANINGSLLEKEWRSQEALDLALQRGGDQAVVKQMDDKFLFYGGKSKATQKITKVRARTTALQIEDIIKKSGNVIVMGHRFADYDAIGSAIAIAQLAKSLNVKSYVVVDSTDQNLSLCFNYLNRIKEFREMMIEKKQAQDLVMSNTLAIMCDVNGLAYCEAPEVVTNASNVIIIDHHRKTGEFQFKPAVAYIEPYASSASELVAEFLECLSSKNQFPKEVYNLLLAGIQLDTKRFTKNTGVRTFAAAHYLRQLGADPIQVEFLFKTKFNDFMVESKLESNVYLHRDIIAISSMEDMDRPSDLARVSASKAADKLLSIEGIKAAFVCCKVDSMVYISARSENQINVQLILEKLGGGGHFDAAGVQLKDCTIHDALISLRGAIDEYLDDLEG